MSDLDVGLCELLAAIPDYMEAEQYYDGSISEVFFGPQMARQLAKSQNLNLRVNLAHTAVDAVADRLEVAGYDVTDPDAQDVIQQIATANQFDIVLPSVFLSALKYGDAFLMMEQDDDGNVLLFENSPLTTRIIYDPANPRVKAFAIRRWAVPDPKSDKTLIRVNLYYPDRVERYISKKQDGDKASDFDLYVSADPDDTSFVVDSQFGFIPIYQFSTGTKNGMPSGAPEHRNAYGPQQSINKVAIQHMAMMDFLSFPQRYTMAAAGSDTSEMEGFTGALDLPVSTDNPLASQPGPDFGQSGSRTPRLESGAGNVWALPAGSEVGEFAAASATNYIESIQMLVKLMAQATSTPNHLFDSYSDRAPSGEALRVDEAPLIKKVKKRAILFAAALQDALDDALYVMKVDASVIVHWASFESSDSLDMWQVVQAKIDAGVPRYDAFIQSGYTPDQLVTMGVTRDTGQSIKDRSAEVIDIGKAAAGLAAGVAAEVVDADQARVLLSSLMAALAPVAEAA